MPSLSSQAFWSMFDEEKDKLAEYVGTQEDVTYYVKVGNDGKERVGEVRWMRSLGTYTYNLLDEQQRDMVLYWYRVKPLEETYREIHTLIRMSKTLLKRAVDLNCNLSSVHDAIAHLSSADASMRAGRPAVPIPPSTIAEEKSAQESAHVPEICARKYAQENLRKNSCSPERTPEQQKALDEFIRGGLAKVNARPGRRR